MRRIIRCTALIILLPCSVVFGQIHISGALSGTLEDTTYAVEGDIWVDVGESLVIEPGAALLFSGYYDFDIMGYLYAVGTAEDSIKFMPELIGEMWGGIKFHDAAADSSRMGYCLITGGSTSGSWPDDCGGGLLIDRCSPVFRNCTITGNSAGGHGGGVYGTGSYPIYLARPKFIECEISNNSCGVDGGGMCFYSCSPLLKDCIISGNSGMGAYSSGGGVGCGESSPVLVGCEISDNVGGWGGGFTAGHSWRFVLKNCTITNNTATLCGGGIAIDEESADILIDSCQITGNVTYGNGGGINVCSGGTRINRCTISQNLADDGGGLSIIGGGTVIENSTIVDNCAEGEAGAILFYSFLLDTIRNSIIADNRGAGGIVHYNWISPSGEIVFNDFHDNQGGNFIGRVPQELGVISYTNANGDSCDRFGNIYLDPMFVSPAGGDYHLQAGSPCIDAGWPHSPFDPDSTVADMGVYYFNQSGVVCGVDGGDFSTCPTEFKLYLAHPNPFNPTTIISFTLPEARRVNLNVYDVSGRLIADLVNGWRDAGNHQVTFSGSGLTSGVYIYRLQAGEFTASGKIVMMK